MIDLPTPPNRFSVTLTVSTERQLRELDAAWREIIAGELPRTQLLEREQGAIRSRAFPALRLLETAIRSHPGTGQCARLARFLAGVYNGPRYPFDLTELRALDTSLANACLDYLNYDRLAKQEVHHHLSGGGTQLNRWISDYRIRPRRT